MPAQPSFLSYTPVSLAFGTSGLRGLVDDITDLEAYINVKGTLRYLVAVGDARPGAGESVVLAGDLRPSSDRIMRAAARAIVDSGFNVENAGKVPTPAVVLRSVSTRRAGVMVTGSHIPFDRNGIKVNKSVGEILKADEPGISREVLGVREEEYARTAASSAFSSRGMLKEPVSLPAIDRAAEEAYVRRYVEGFGRDGLRGESVLVYEHSAVGRETVARILRELGADVVARGRAETFVPIDTENVTDELLDRLDALVVGAEAEGHAPRVVVSTDGDSDRPLVAAVLAPGAGPRRVRFLPGDLLGIVTALHVGAGAVAVPISASDAVDRAMEARGVTVDKTKIGSPYVVAALDALVRGPGARTVVGWEANGGFLLASRLTLGGVPIEPLVTRDAVLPIIANLFAARQAGVTLDALWDTLPARFGRSGLKDGVPVEVSRAIMRHLVPEGGSLEVTVSPGAIGARGGDAAAWTTSLERLRDVFAQREYGTIARVNVMDGVRVTFEGGDVVHVRPSGNAPQLRVYAVASSEARADRLVQMGLGESDGVLAQLIRAVS